MELLVMLLISVVAVAAAAVVVSASDPFTSAIALVVNFAALGVLYITLSATFVAMAQVIVYAGAVVVMFLFVLGYLGERREIVGSARRAGWTFALAGASFVVLFVASLFAVTNKFNFNDLPDAASASDGFGGVRAFGETLLTDYLLHFEATSLVLLVAAIGGVVLGLTGRSYGARLHTALHTRSADEQRRVLRDARKSDAADRDLTEAGSR